MSGWRGFFSGLLSAGLIAGSAARGDDKPAQTAKAGPPVDFKSQVLPILQQSCIDCHNAELHFAGLRFDRRDLALKGGDSGSPVRPGKSAESLLIRRLVDRDAGVIMPPTFPFCPGEKVGLPEEQIELLKAWIDQGAPWPADVAVVGPEPATVNSRLPALFAAIRAGDLQKTASLLETDRTLVNAADRNGTTPLLYAATCSDSEVLKLLIDRGADVNRADREGGTALMFAADDVDKVRLLVDKGAKVDAKSGMGRTPLIIAATHAGNLEVVRLLIRKGAKVADQDLFGETPLTGAAKRGDTALVEELVAAGADLNAGGRPPLYWAAEQGTVETLEALLKHGAGANPMGVNMALGAAAARGPARAVRLLVEAGADPNGLTPFNGYTPLMWVAYSEYKSPEAVQLLLAKGANVKVVGKDKSTALSLAKKRGKTKVVELLEAAGATE